MALTKETIRLSKGLSADSMPGWIEMSIEKAMLLEAYVTLFTFDAHGDCAWCQMQHQLPSFSGVPTDFASDVAGPHSLSYYVRVLLLYGASYAKGH